MADAITIAAERGVRQILEQRGREHQQQGDGERAHDSGELSPGARGLGHRRARRAAADREALKEARRDVGDPEAHHLLVRVDRCPQTRRIGSREYARVGEGDEGDGEATREDRTEALDRHQWQMRRRQPLRQGTEDRDAGARAEIERSGHDRWQRRPRAAWPGGAASASAPESARAHRRRLRAR